MSQKTYKAVLFDMDGTLLDNHTSFHHTYDCYCDRYPEILHRENETQRAELIDIYYKPMAQRPAIYEAFCRKWGWEGAPDWDEWIFHYLRNVLMFPWTMETLNTLKRKGMPLALITNGNSLYQHTKIESSGLKTLFDVVIVSGDIGIDKPDPAIFHLCTDQLGIPAEDCLFVGDKPEADIAGAKAAGMDSLLVSGKPDTTGATYVADDITFLNTLI